MKIETLVLATRNPHKAEEIKKMLSGLALRILDLRDFPQCPEVEEDLDTLEENAMKKAVIAHEFTGLPVIADDSGLEVHYLLGKPGVHSARYAGENATYADNNRKLLRALTQVPPRKRDARFLCVIAFAAKGIRDTFIGTVEGMIAFKPQGRHGFGYDPLFIPSGYTKTYAELLPEEKNKLSHRGRAIKKFIEYLSN